MVAELILTSLAPEAPDSSWPAAIRRHTDKADRLFNSGILEETLREYEAALAIAPDDAYLHNNRGATLAKLNRRSDAQVAFAKAVELNPKNPIMLRNKAYALWELGKLKEALSTLGSLNHPITDDALRALRDLHLHNLAKRQLISWSGGKPKGSDMGIELTPGPAISEWIIESRR